MTTAFTSLAWRANRDGAEPDESDITADRGRARALTFGAGRTQGLADRCLGAAGLH